MYAYMCESLIWSHKSLIDSDLRTIKEPVLNSTYLLVFDVSIRYLGLMNYLAT